MMPPLLEHPMQHLLAQLEQSESRWMVGMAGLPGAGKSTLATRLVEAVNARTAPHAAMALGMDGFHLSKAQLSQMPDPAEAFARRGAPWTFDAEALRDRLQLLRAAAGHAAVVWPDFQHGIGDPVEGVFTVMPTTRLVLVEGLYLLHDADGWEAIRSNFDELWYLDTPWEVALERLTQRHMRAWGLTLSEAESRVAANDSLNAQVVLKSGPFADWRVTM